MIFHPALEKELKELLAVIHRDGGHHTHNVGLLQSIKDAITEVLRTKQKLAENGLLD